MSLCCRGMTNGNLATGGYGGYYFLIAIVEDTSSSGGKRARASVHARGKKIHIDKLIREDEELLAIIVIAHKAGVFK